MKIYTTKNKSPFYTLVCEEIILKDEQNHDDILYLYQHKNAIIIGRNQNIYEEIKLEEVKKENIEIYRRLSGGGAVYHDLGNINFSFITGKQNHSYQKFLEPIIEFFRLLGLKAEFKGRNDLIVNGAKVSGNAQIIYKDKIVHHGTILFNANLAKLAQVLKPNKLKIESKGIKSVRQRVTNILHEMEEQIDDNEFIFRLISFFEKKYKTKSDDVENYFENGISNQENFHQISEFRKSKNWVFGTNPFFSYENTKRTSAGILKVLANIEKNLITKIKFEGDFLSKRSIEEIQVILESKEFSRNSLEKELGNIDNLEEYFGLIPLNEILDTIFGN
ncbi:lipoate--protein ligase [Mesomycoplasma flocculare]|uniref:lipoate--protein ligase n=1 Tax=Mesomycoplasma flocculare ATCC 27399 TaxID=743971 RepID=A0A0A8E785_MESFC|nr:lipoate--protein ligase [Mesomycoplasma flocculare]AJC49883.1 lipoate-protein ligase A [Mesomycoplasma flocculare ATCC 27399]ENX51219.1 lipoate-protein ligase A [Mesomycoplasma flocculare ATCC 27716]MXR22986.1 lipoyltransferase [Mesomycoplasma flocculare]